MIPQHSKPSIFISNIQIPSLKFDNEHLISGIATSSVGAATNIGTSIVEKLLNSKQIKDLNAAFERDKMLTTKFERQIEEVKRHQDSPHLSLLYYSIKQFLGADHLLMAILKEVLLSALVNVNGEEEILEMASLMKQESKDGVQYNPLDAGALVEGGKVIGQNSFKMAGQVCWPFKLQRRQKDKMKNVKYLIYTTSQFSREAAPTNGHPT